MLYECIASCRRYRNIVIEKIAQKIGKLWYIQCNR